MTTRFPILLISAVSAIFLATCFESASALSVQCKGVNLEVTEQHMMDIKECLAGVNVASPKDISPDKLGCLIRCVMTNKGLIDADNKPHKENINKIIDEALPPALVDEWKGEVGKCLDKEGMAIKSAADDPTCSSFVPLGICFHMSFMRVCKS